MAAVMAFAPAAFAGETEALENLSPAPQKLEMPINIAIVLGIMEAVWKSADRNEVVVPESET